MNIKTDLDDLAVCGKPPAFGEKLHVGSPALPDSERFLERLQEAFHRRCFTNNGPFVQELETRIADLLSVRHCIACCNGTLGLEMSIRAAELSGEVIVPSMTFISTVNALQWHAITPVFCDIDPQTFQIDPLRVEALITDRTTGVIGVHLWGRTCDVDSLVAISRKHNLSLLFDAAHAFGCSHRGRMVGGFGDAEVFSFHATKFFHTLEGGAVTTNNDELANNIRLLRNHGFIGEDNVSIVGTNAKLNEISAAMGLTLLEDLDKLMAVNECNYQLYRRELGGIRGVYLLAFDDSEKCNCQYVVLHIDEKVTAISRDQLVHVLRAENVLARRYFHPGCHQMKPYRALYPQAIQRLPETEKIARRVLCLPTGTGIGANEISMICRILRIAVENGRELSMRLRDLTRD